MVYQVISICHHFKPCLAEYSKAWWLLCQPSPNESNATHLIKITWICSQNQLVKASESVLYMEKYTFIIRKIVTKNQIYYQLFFDKSPVFQTWVPHIWLAEFTNHVMWYTHVVLTPCITMIFFNFLNLTRKWLFNMIYILNLLPKRCCKIRPV